MSDCDNCIYLDQDDNGEYCHKGHKTLITNCCDYEHWNTLTDEEVERQCNEKRLENDKRNL